MCLVVNRAGIDAASADLLRSSGFLNRLLHSTGDPESNPVQLMIAVTMLDAVATAEYQNEKKTKPREEVHPKQVHLAAIHKRLPVMVAEQLQSELKRIIVDLEGAAREASELAIARILANLQVYPLTAQEFIKCKQQDEEDKSFINVKIHVRETGAGDMLSILRVGAALADSIQSLARGIC